MYNPFKKRYNTNEHRLMDCLSHVHHFNKLTDDELSLFLSYMYLRSYKQNEVVFFSGDPSHALYLIKEGGATLTIDINDRFEQLVAVGVGQTFGDNSLIEGSKRIYTAKVTSEEAKIFVIPQINLLEILKDHPIVHAKVLTSFSEYCDQFVVKLFKTYQADFGFFELRKVYQD